MSVTNETVQLAHTSFTVEEVIFQAMSSIACFSCTATKKVNMPNPSHAAMLMGTHKDLLKSNPEIKDKDDALQKNLEEISKPDVFELDKNFLCFVSNDQLMFAIDKMTG